MEAVEVSSEKGIHQFKSFASYPVTAGYSDRTFNMRFLEDQLPDSHDRELFCQRLQIQAVDLVTPEQIHSGNIILVSEEMKGRGALRRDNAVARADGMIVKERGIPLGVQTADCASVILYDPQKHSAGIAHVGWRGLYAGLPGKMVAAFTNNFLCRPKDIRVGLGPMIRKCCYEVGWEMASYFTGYVATRNGKNHLDLGGAIVADLHAMGVPKNHIEDCGVCTSCQNDRFFSYRREGNLTGRMLSVIMLR